MLSGLCLTQGCGGINLKNRCSLKEVLVSDIFGLGHFIKPGSCFMAALEAPVLFTKSINVRPFSSYCGRVAMEP
jgi:hypothetical protein